ncbi:hypothetical protein M8494_23140 [Serratia ureilytica]
MSVLLLAGFVTIFDLFVVNVAIPACRPGWVRASRAIGFYRGRLRCWPSAC